MSMPDQSQVASVAVFDPSGGAQDLGSDPDVKPDLTFGMDIAAICIHDAAINTPYAANDELIAATYETYTTGDRYNAANGEDFAAKKVSPTPPYLPLVAKS